MKYIGIVSEDKSIIHTLKIILKEYYVEEIKSIEVIEKINKNEPFLIFIDTYLSEINPIELIEKINIEKPEILIVLLISNYDKIVRDILEREIFDIIEKPFLVEKIFHVLKKAEKWINLSLNKDSYKSQAKVFDKNIVKENEFKNYFFQTIFKCIAENFLEIKKICYEILKILRYFFQFNSLTIFLKEEGIFKIYASLGIDENICKTLELNSNSFVIKWFLSENKIIDIRNISLNWELKSFLRLLNATLIIPLKTFNGKLIGFLTIGEKSVNEEITNDDIFTLTLFCDYISIVFDNFFLYSEIAYQKKYQEFLLENLPLGIIGVEKDGKINLLNNYGEKILKVVFNEVKGKKIEKVGSQIADIVRKALMYGEKVYRIEINYIPGKIILGLSTNIIKDDSGNIIGAMCVFQDITKIKELEKKEKEMERNKYWSLISSRLSHELKNPLVAINTFAQMLPNMYDDKEFREKFSGIVIEEVKRINEIVNMINNIGEDIEIKGEEIDFNKFLDEFVSEKDIEKRNLYNLDLVIKGDILKLKEAFSNIFEFIKEDNEKNKIFMEVIKTENLLKIIFSEKGEKIKIMDEDEIFIPFNPKLEPKLSIKMLIARKIIEKHHGELKIEISPQGKNFIITLPLKNE